jgi:hypothetical protein
MRMYDDDDEAIIIDIRDALGALPTGSRSTEIDAVLMTVPGATQDLIDEALWREVDAFEQNAHLEQEIAVIRTHLAELDSVAAAIDNPDGMVEDLLDFAEQRPDLAGTVWRLRQWLEPFKEADISPRVPN